MTIAGLSLNVIGTALLFFFGFPQPEHGVSPSVGLEDGTPVGGITAGEVRQRAAAKKQIYRRLAYLALSLLLSGFALQLAGAVA